MEKFKFQAKANRRSVSDRLERPPIDLYDRVFQEAFKMISVQEEFNDAESLAKIKKILNDPNYQRDIRVKWNAEDIAGGYEKDPEEQEKERAVQVAEEVKNKARMKRTYQ